MRKIIACFLCISLLLLSSCSDINVNEDPQLPIESEVQFESSYIRTNGYHEDIGYPAIRVMRSAEDLTSYYEQYKDLYDFDAGWDGIPLMEAIEKYNATYFEDQVLLMVLLEEPSGSNRHKVNSLCKNSQGEIEIAIETMVPESGTDDMAEWHLMIEPEAGFEFSEGSAIQVILDKEKHTLYERVEFSKGAANMALNKLEDWKYEIVDYNEAPDLFGIRFHPVDETEGAIMLCYYPGGFGVCGTGLKTEKVTVGKWEANQGTYDEKEYWDFIHLLDTPGDYVFMTEGKITWWEKYEEDIKTIVSTALIAQNCDSQSHIEEIIKLYADEISVEYDDYTVHFDYGTGLWTIDYRKNEEKVRTLRIRAHGAIVE
ncbi:MAG: hypothetical protein IJ407_02320 [Clostridia bacterium]|nr:hypothetical protein [Clostridia bacterium]